MTAYPNMLAPLDLGFTTLNLNSAVGAEAISGKLLRSS